MTFNNLGMVKKLWLTYFGISLISISIAFIVAGYYPTINDINGVLKISNLDGSDKWVNGFYGPGYTLLSYLIGSSLKNYGLFTHALIIVTYFLAYYLSRILIIKHQNYVLSSFILLTFLNIIVFINGLNYTDGIPLFLAISGILLILISNLNDSNNKKLLLGLFIIGTTVFFRHHFVILVTFTSIFLLIHKTNNISKIIYLCTPLAVLFLFNIIIGEEQNWQKFNLYKYTYGVNWYEIDILLDSKEYNEFSFIESIYDDYILIFKKTIWSLFYLFKSLFIIVSINILVAYQIFEKKKWLIFTTLLIVYLFLILPGAARGSIPLYILPLYLITMYGNKLLNQGKLRYVILCLTIFLLFWKGYRFTESLYDVSNEYYVVEYKLKKTLDNLSKKHEIETVFTDDYNLFFMDNEYKIDNFRGWLNKSKGYNFSSIRTKFESNDYSKYDIYILRKNGYFLNKYSLDSYKVIQVDKWYLYYDPSTI